MGTLEAGEQRPLRNCCSVVYPRGLWDERLRTFVCGHVNKIKGRIEKSKELDSITISTQNSSDIRLFFLSQQFFRAREKCAFHVFPSDLNIFFPLPPLNQKKRYFIFLLPSLLVLTMEEREERNHMDGMEANSQSEQVA